MGLNGLIPKEFEKKYAENMKKNQFGWKWAGLFELFSRQLP
jgi:hypothetical protein